MPSLEPLFQAQYPRASTAAIYGAFNIPIATPCRSIKRASEDHSGVKEEIRNIEEEFSQPKLKTNGRRSSKGEEIRRATNPPPKPPEKKSINKQWSKSTTDKGDFGIKGWKEREAKINGNPPAISLWLRATRGIYCHRAPEAGGRILPGND
ncbi:unnamed protein product [Linum trigynum]|uniref:Uncharacterized protein n=1 Tax=Linum trigynum TaxID=586398 RepID=A0AAV2E695_9ROSI